MRPEESLVVHNSVREILEGKGSIKVGQHHDGDFHTYMAHKISKLQSTNSLPSKDIVSNIFLGCYVFINGATKPPIEELRRLITKNGGTSENYQVSRITHFVCDHFTDAQLRRIREKVRIKDKMIYVVVQWVLDSISVGKKLSEAEYAPIGLRDRHGSNIMQIFSRNDLEAASL